MSLIPDIYLQCAPVASDLTLVRGRTLLARHRLLYADAGGSIAVPVDGVDVACSALDLSDKTMTAAIRDAAGELVLVLTATGGADGWLRITASATAAAALEQPCQDDAWPWRWDVRIADSGGQVCTPLRGRVRYLDDQAEGT